MKRDTALQIQRRALTAVKELIAILPEIDGECDEEEHQRIKRGIGLSVGDIQIEILEILNAQYPEIDDLRDMPDPR